MDDIARWIGYVVMAAGGMALSVLLLSLAVYFAWSMWAKGLNALDVVEACTEWRKNNPEKFKRWKERNGVDKHA